MASDDSLDAQLRLAAIVESSDDAIVSKNLDGVVTSWNPAAEAMFGFSSDEMVGQSIRHIIPDDRQNEEDLVLSKIRRGERVDHYETIRQRKDGTFVPVSLTVSPIRNTHGIIVGASKIARDISERKRAEEERQRLLVAAREAGQLKDQFLATLSHELRTPLNAIIGYLRMIESGLLAGEKHKHALQVVTRNAVMLGQMIEDVLDVSRIVSGRVRISRQVVELGRLVSHACDSVQPLAQAKRITLQGRATTAPVFVIGDPERLQQILWNLLSNGVKFTPEGGQVTVSIEHTESEVTIAITDTGIGMSSAFVPRAFDRFSQEDSTLTRVHGGLGLGLAISQQLAGLQGGRVVAQSEGQGKGSTFSLTLPTIAADVAALEGRPDEQPREGPIPVVPKLRGVSVLAVDDDRDALALVREILEMTGATVTTADSAADALAKMTRVQPDVLIADVAMPMMSGLELIERVRASDDVRVRRIPAVALTAFARSEERAQSIRAGFQVHLSKPVEPWALMEAVASLS